VKEETMSKKRIAPIARKPRPSVVHVPAGALTLAEDAGALADDSALVSGLAGVVQEQIDEYELLLEEVVEKATGRPLWGGNDCLAHTDYDSLNRKSSAISYLLVMMGEKAGALESRARNLRVQAATPVVPAGPPDKSSARAARRRAA
jgi:hypothetical protein